MLSEPDRARVEDAVRRAETATAGEIVVVLARQAASYRSIPLVFALAAALATPWPLIGLTELPAIRIFAVQIAVAIAVAAATSLPAIRLALVPAIWKRARAREAAEREFVARGLADTRGRTGILLYVAEAEHFAEVIGDLAISSRVDEAAWRGVIETLIVEFAAGRLTDGLVAAIARIGAILAEHVPPGSDDVDELPNRVVLL